MKKVMINGYFVDKHINGIPRYAMEIVKRLDKNFAQGEIELIVPKNAINIPNLDNIQVIRIGKKDERTAGILWGNTYFRKYVCEHNAGCINFTNHAEFVRNSLTTLHDAIWSRKDKYELELLQKENRKLFFKRLIERGVFYSEAYVKKKTAQYIITVSEFSKVRIAREFGIEHNRIKVIGAGWEHMKGIQSVNEFNDSRICKNNYFFSLGNIYPHKNVKWIIDEAKRMPEEIFVIAGKMPYKFVDVFKEDFPNIIFLGHISEGFMKYLMENCKALLFPSLEEGFGVPPLEALSLGTQVIVSDIPVMREIYKDTVHYIDPVGKPVDLNEILNKKTNGDISEILEKHSWDETAKQWEQLIREVYA